MKFIADKSWTRDARAIRVLLWSQYRGAPNPLRKYTGKDGSYIKGFYDRSDWTLYVKNFRIGTVEWTEPASKDSVTIRHSAAAHIN